MRRERGFTLVEMLIVLTILALGAALAMPYFARGRGAASLGAAVQEVRMALATARSAAIAEDRDVTFVGGSGGFRIDGAPHGVTAAAIEVMGQPAIVFYPSGASNGGRIVVRAATAEREIDVEALTGHAVLLP